MITSPLPHASGAPPETAAPAGGKARAGLLRRALTAADNALAALLYWQKVSRTIEQLRRADDAQLKALGLERTEIVAWVLREARERQTR